jgi:hypothetical protein
MIIIPDFYWRNHRGCGAHENSISCENPCTAYQGQRLNLYSGKADSNLIDLDWKKVF